MNGFRIMTSDNGLSSTTRLADSNNSNFRAFLQEGAGT